MHKRRCFVISPIGEEGSETRQHADDVLDYIIKPAMEEVGIAAERSDHMSEPGKISDQMFRNLIEGDLCIAVLTGQNPNVFYELAVAQAASRPVIVLVEKGESIPFDIQDLRCVLYDLKPRPLFERVYVKNIVDHVRNLEQSDWAVNNFFGATTPLRLRKDVESPDFLQASSHFGSPDDWARLLMETREVFDLMGISLSAWRRTRKFREVLTEKAEQGCRIRILVMHEENPVLPHLINEGVKEVTLEGVRAGLGVNCEFFSGIADSTDNVEFRKILRGCPHSQTTRADQQAVYIPYLYSERSDFSPLWRCATGTPLYSMVVQEFESLWNANGPAQTAGLAEEG